jgi:hypothetical protein
VEITREGLNDLLKPMAKGRTRYEFLRNNWNELSRSYPVIVNANTDTASGALTTGILSEGVFTVLQSRLAPLAAFTRNFSSTPAGRNVIYVPKVTAGGTAQANPTSFEDTTNFVGSVDDVPITPAHIVSGAHITNAELQNGWRMAWWIDVKVGEFSDKLQSLVNAIITTGNFTATPLTFAASSFGVDELRQAWATIKKARVKNIMLDGEYYANFLPANMESFNPLSGNTYPGWDGFYHNTYWTGATANTTGFACNPQAICIGAALPMQAVNMVGSANLVKDTTTLPDLGMSVDVCQWFSTSSRTAWWTIECMFGAALGDGTAGVLIKSS